MLTIPPARYLLPGLFTLASTFCGFAVLVLAATADSADDYYRAAILIPLACLLDGFDGRVARLLHGESRLGAQLDSLSDLATFGIAPAFLLWSWALQPLGGLGIGVAFAFVAASMTRLARFNVIDAEPHDGHVARYFTGLPAPMGGNALATLVALEAGFLGRAVSSGPAAGWIAALVVLIALLMVSNVPFRTFKDLRMTPLNRLLVAGAIAATVGVSLAVDLMVAVAIGLAGYIGLTLSTAVVRTTARRARTAFPRGGHAHDPLDYDDDRADD
jgi:CDP-diacylglycerol--serine O-phosphatidyltransferase